jgi:methyltransferase (TIGR00027 family)
MKPISPSAKGVAYLRHLEVAVSLDSLARYFTDEEGERFAKQWLSWCPYVGRTVAIRGRFTDDVAALYIDRGISQMMNVAAGLNTFPYRHPVASKLSRYVELDLPSMIDFKRERMAELGQMELLEKDAPAVEYCPVDLGSEKFEAELAYIDWDSSRPSICVLEGISYYFPKDKLQRIIDSLTGILAEGSVLIMDYFPDFVRSNGELTKIMNGIVSAGGETCLTYLSPKDAASMLGRFDIVLDRLESDLEPDYYSDRITKQIGSIITAEIKRNRMKDRGSV